MLSAADVPERSYKLGGIEWPCPDATVVTPGGQWFGWFTATGRGQWLYMGQYDRLHCEAMLRAGCKYPRYDSRPA